MTPSLSAPTRGSRAARATASICAGFGEGALGVGEDLGAGGCHVDAFIGAFEERDAELALKLADLAAEGGLADVASFRGAAEVAVLGDGDEVAEFLKVHGEAVRVRMAAFRYRERIVSVETIDFTYRRRRVSLSEWE